MEKNFATLPVQWKSRVSPNIRIHGLQHVGKLHLIDYLGSGLVDPRLWTVSSALHLIQCICMTWLWKQKPAQTNVPKCNIVAVLGLQQLLSTAFCVKILKIWNPLAFPFEKLHPHWGQIVGSSVELRQDLGHHLDLGPLRSLEPETCEICGFTKIMFCPACCLLCRHSEIQNGEKCCEVKWIPICEKWSCCLIDWFQESEAATANGIPARQTIKIHTITILPSCCLPACICIPE